MMSLIWATFISDNERGDQDPSAHAHQQSRSDQAPKVDGE